MHSTSRYIKKYNNYSNPNVRLPPPTLPSLVTILYNTRTAPTIAPTPPTKNLTIKSLKPALPRCAFIAAPLNCLDEAVKVVVMYAERARTDPRAGTVGTGVAGVVATKLVTRVTPA